MGLMLERKKEMREKLKIFIGRSTNLVTLETVLHVYQLVMQQPDIEINLDGINWATLIDNSKKKLLIPMTNDRDQIYTDTIQTTRINNQVRIKNVENFQKIKTYESRTPAGNYSLWICADDENSKVHKESPHEKDPLWKHYSRMKRLAVESSEMEHESEIQINIKSLEVKRNHFFDIEAQIDEEQKDGKFLAACICIQKRYRGHRSRQHFNTKQIKRMRDQILNRDIIELLAKYKGKTTRLLVLKSRYNEEKKEFDTQQAKIDNLTENRDRDKLTVDDKVQKHAEANEDYNSYYKLYDEQREKSSLEEREVRTL